MPGHGLSELSRSVPGSEYVMLASNVSLIAGQPRTYILAAVDERSGTSDAAVFGQHACLVKTI